MRQDLVASYKGGPQRGFNFKSSTWHALQYCSLCDSRRLASSALSRACRSGRNLHPGLSKRMCKAEAASITLAGGLSSMASLSSSSGAADQSSHSNPVPKKQANRLSIDPQASGDDIIVIHSPAELEHILESNPDKLVCLMCKAIGCRPCKVFARKYQRIASAYSDCVFLECTGDETIDLRRLMIQMGIRSTPTFRMYRQGECIRTHTGIDDQKLKDALSACLEEGKVLPPA